MTTQLRLLLSRLAALVWFLLFALLLLYAWNRQDEPSMPEELAWLMSSLTAPFGFLIAMAADSATTAATRRAGWSYHPFWHLVPMWLAMTGAGYYQWFVALPRFVRNYRESTRAAQPAVTGKLEDESRKPSADDVVTNRLAAAAIAVLFLAMAWELAIWNTSLHQSALVQHLNAIPWLRGWIGIGDFAVMLLGGSGLAVVAFIRSRRARPESTSSGLPVVALGLSLVLIAVVAWILLNLHVPF